MSAAQRLLDRLDRPRQTAPGRWAAGCPCCQSKKGRPVTVRELDDRVLLHAFCGCDTESVLGALGLQLNDLFERPLGHHAAPARRAGLSAREALELAEHEITAAALILADAASGRALNTEELQRLAQAAGRIGKLRGATHG